MPDKQKILEETDFQSLYDRYLNLRKNGSHVKEGWIGNLHSPFRKDKNPSFSVNVHHGGWKDFNGESGDAIDFIMKSEHKDFKEALEFIAENFTNGRAKIVKKISSKEKKKTVRPITKAQIDVFCKNLLDNIYPEASEIVKKRGITNEVIKRHRIGINRYFDKKTERNLDEVIIPFKFDDSGNAVEFKRLRYYKGDKAVEIKDNDTPTIVKLPQFTSGSAQLFPKSVLENENLILVEGELDALAMLSKGFTAVTGTAGANTFTNPMADELSGKNVTVLYDNDEGGEKGSVKVCEKLQGIAATVRKADWKFFEKLESGGFKVPEKFDVSDYFELGKDVDLLKKMITDAEIIDVETDKVKRESDHDKKEQLSERFYHTVETKAGEKHHLIHQRVVDYIIDDWKICGTQQGSKNKVFYRYNKGYWKELQKPELVRYIATKLLYYPTTHRQVNDIANLLWDMTYVHPDKFNSRMDLVNLDNCAYDTVNMKIITHDPEHYFTFKNQYKYEPGADCPNFRKALRMYSKNDDQWCESLQEIFGYCLTHGYRIQKMFWFFGNGRNGKGTVIRVLEKIVGEEMTLPNINPKSLSGQFDRKDLMNKKLAYEGDLDKWLPNINVIKMITGGDKIRSDQKWGDTISFVNQAKIILLMNQFPQIPAGQNLNALFRRVYLLPFDYKIREGTENSDIEEKFESELSGIFNWAIKGLKRLKDQFNQFTPCERGEELIERFSDTANSFLSFFDERVVFEEGAEIWSNDLFLAYSEYMKDHYGYNWQKVPDPDIVNNPWTFGREISKQFGGRYDFIENGQKYYRDRQGNASYWKGIRLKTEADIAEEIRLYGDETEIEEDISF